MVALIDTEAAVPGRHAEILASAVLPGVMRARALIDANPASQTFGCADRAYWYYRTLTNFPGATWQQLMVAFAALYRTRHAANPYYACRATAEIAGALMAAWARAQHRDGAFDEWYLNEHSYCPTAITAAGAALTIHLLGDALPPSQRSSGTAALEMACRWLERRYNPDVMNQNIAAAVALQGMAALMPGSRWGEVANRKLARIAADQTEEGWLPEYSGMDLGYSTLALDFLAAFRMLGGGDLAEKMASRLSRFLVDVRGAGAGLPGALGSRGTSHAFPFGALYFSAGDTNAASLAAGWIEALRSRYSLSPATVDDRYFAYFYQPQFALAFMQAAATPQLDTSGEAPAIAADRRESGMLVIRRRGWSVSVSRRLGGAIAVESPGKPPLYHLGYEVTTAEGRRYSSAVWQNSDAVPIWIPGEPLVFRARFRTTSSGVPLRRWMIPFQIVVHLLLSSQLAGRFQQLVKRKMIAPKREAGLTLERRIEIAGDQVYIRDTLIPDGAVRVRITALHVAPAISMHSPSARQGEPRPLAHQPEAVLDGAHALLSDGKAATILWRWSAELPAALRMARLEDAA